MSKLLYWIHKGFSEKERRERNCTSTAFLHAGIDRMDSTGYRHPFSGPSCFKKPFSRLRDTGQMLAPFFSS